MKYLALIPARGGSKRIINKNIKSLNGKPLIQYTIDAAKKVFNLEDICVSTDDIKIKKTVEKLGLDVPFLRPNYLAQDTSGTHDVIIHAIDFYKSIGKEYDAIVLLQPTSPLRNDVHIRDSLMYYSENIDIVVSVKVSSSNPYYNLFEETQEGFLIKSKNGYFERYQDCPKVYEYNGAIYIINIKSIEKEKLHQLNKIQKFIMDDYSSLDIDTILDFKFVEFLLRNKLNE